MNGQSLIDLPRKEALSILRLAPGSVSLVIRRNFREEARAPLPPDSPLPPESQQHNDTETDSSSVEGSDIPLPPHSPLPPETMRESIPSTQHSLLKSSTEARRTIESLLPTLTPQESNVSVDMDPPLLPSSPLPSEPEDTTMSIDESHEILVSMSVDPPSLEPHEILVSMSVDPPLLEPHESLVSLETEPPPVPSASLLPQESSTSLEIEARPLTNQDSQASLEAPPPSTRLRPQDTVDTAAPPIISPSELPLEDTLEQEPDKLVLDSSGEWSDIDDLSDPPLPPSDDEAPPTHYGDTPTDEEAPPPGPHSPLPLDND